MGWQGSEQQRRAVEARVLREAEFSTAERSKLADKGHAMPDGSFPIRNASDLRNAIQALGRAKNRAAAMAHIRKRAKALGLEKLLPSSAVQEAQFDDLLHPHDRMGRWARTFRPSVQSKTGGSGFDLFTSGRMKANPGHIADAARNAPEKNGGRFVIHHATGQPFHPHQSLGPEYEITHREVHPEGHSAGGFARSRKSGQIVAWRQVGPRRQGTRMVPVDVAHAVDKGDPDLHFDWAQSVRLHANEAMGVHTEPQDWKAVHGSTRPGSKGLALRTSTQNRRSLRGPRTPAEHSEAARQSAATARAREAELRAAGNHEHANDYRDIAARMDARAERLAPASVHVDAETRDRMARQAGIGGHLGAFMDTLASGKQPTKKQRQNALDHLDSVMPDIAGSSHAIETHRGAPLSDRLAYMGARGQALAAFGTSAFPEKLASAKTKHENVLRAIRNDDETRDRAARQAYDKPGMTHREAQAEVRAMNRAAADRQADENQSQPSASHMAAVTQGLTDIGAHSTLIDSFRRGHPTREEWRQAEQWMRNSRAALKDGSHPWLVNDPDPARRQQSTREMMRVHQRITAAMTAYRRANKRRGA